MHHYHHQHHHYSNNNNYNENDNHHRYHYHQEKKNSSVHWRSKILLAIVRTIFSFFYRWSYGIVLKEVFTIGNKKMIIFAIDCKTAPIFAHVKDSKRRTKRLEDTPKIKNNSNDDDDCFGFHFCCISFLIKMLIIH